MALPEGCAVADGERQFAHGFEAAELHGHAVELEQRHHKLILAELHLKVAKLFFRQFRLLEDAAESAGRNIFRVHRDVSLPAIGMTQHDMRT